ncbi:MAG TPA: AraC family transcriptional regulator [Polyangiaceae bacterium]|nr:AraC family transcriptional regulator [Polyangiaceae bacterium]
MTKSDALSELLRDVRLTGAVFLYADFGAPWGFRAPAAIGAARLLAPEAERLVPFHLLLEGEAEASVCDSKPLRLAAGDLIVFPSGEEHVLRNGPDDDLVDSSFLLPKILEGGLVYETGGGGGPRTRFVCGYVACDRQATRLLLSGLPPMFSIGIRGTRSGPWIESAFGELVTESQAPRAGSRALLAKLAEVLFVEILCQYMQALPAEYSGWLAAARDPAIGAALAAMHRDPGAGWTLANLAARAGLSRTIFIERFTRLVGESPAAYLASTRLHSAARRLHTTSDTVLEIALAVGYQSEAAFNRAFKRQFALPPSRFRKQPPAS